MAATGNTPCIKKIKLRLQRSKLDGTPQSVVTPRTKLMYTVAKKYNPPTEEASYLPIPGSLEEDLTATPDSFFDVQPHFLPPIVKKPIGMLWGALTPSARGYAVKEKNHDGEEEYRKVNRVFTFNVTNKESGSPSKLKKGSKKVDVPDEELKRRYTQIKLNLKNGASISTLTVNTQISQQIQKHEHSFSAYNTIQKIWDRTLKNSCEKVGREVDQSIMTKAERFREKMEKYTAQEMQSPTGIRQGSLSWYLSLRASPNIRDKRNCLLPVGNNYGGLWINLIPRSKNNAELVRKHQSITNNSLLNGSKVGSDHKKLGELLAVKEDALDYLQVTGESAFRVEYEGFKECKCPKVIDKEVAEEWNNNQNDMLDLF